MKVVVEVVIDRLDFVMEEGVESIAEVLGGWDVSSLTVELGELFNETE